VHRHVVAMPLHQYVLIAHNEVDESLACFTGDLLVNAGNVTLVHPSIQGFWVFIKVIVTLCGPLLSVSSENQAVQQG
jgi:hypothetical protein